MVHGPRLAELVPRRAAFYVILLISGFSIVLALGLLYRIGLLLGPRTTDGVVSAFDLDSEGSIASWFSIIVLFLCGLVTLLVRTLRMAAGAGRHESIGWLAVACLWFLMSLDEGASLHEGFKEMMVLITGRRIMGDGSVYWAVPYFALLSAAGLFLLNHVRRSSAAVICLLSSGFCFAIAIAAQLDFILRGKPFLETWLEESGEMMGQLLILACVSMFARSEAWGCGEAAPLGRGTTASSLRRPAA